MDITTWVKEIDRLKTEVTRLTAELTTAHSNGYREGAEAMKEEAAKVAASIAKKSLQGEIWILADVPDAIRALPLPTAPDTAKEES